MSSAEFIVLANRRKDHNHRMDRELHTIHDIIEKFAQEKDDDAVVDAGREQLRLSVLRKNVAIETSYRDRKYMEQELKEWAENALKRGEESMAEVLEAAEESNAAIADAVGDPSLALLDMEPSSDLLLSIKNAIRSLQEYGKRVLDLAKACQRKELSLDEFSRKMAIEVNGVQGLLQDPTQKDDLGRRGSQQPEKQGSFRGKVVHVGEGRPGSPMAGSGSWRPAAALQLELNTALNVQKSQRQLIDDLEVEIVDAQEQKERIQSQCNDLLVECRKMEKELNDMKSARFKLHFSKATQCHGGGDLGDESVGTQTDGHFPLDGSSLGRKGTRQALKREQSFAAPGSPTLGGMTLASLRSNSVTRRSASGMESEVSDYTLFDSLGTMMNCFNRQYRNLKHKKHMLSVAFFLYRLASKTREERVREASNTDSDKIRALNKKVAKKIRECQAQVEEAQQERDIAKEAMQQLVLKLKVNEETRAELTQREYELQMQVEELEKIVTELEEADPNNKTTSSLSATRRAAAGGGSGSSPSRLTQDQLQLPVRCIEALAAYTGAMRFLFSKVDRMVHTANTTTAVGNVSPGSRSPQQQNLQPVSSPTAPSPKLGQQLRYTKEDACLYQELEMHLVGTTARLSKIVHPNIGQLRRHAEMMLDRVEEVTQAINSQEGGFRTAAPLRSHPASPNARPTSARNSPMHNNNVEQQEQQRKTSRHSGSRSRRESLDRLAATTGGLGPIVDPTQQVLSSLTGEPMSVSAAGGAGSEHDAAEAFADYVQQQEDQQRRRSSLGGNDNDVDELADSTAINTVGGLDARRGTRPPSLSASVVAPAAGGGGSSKGHTHSRLASTVVSSRAASKSPLLAMTAITSGRNSSNPSASRNVSRPPTRGASSMSAVMQQTMREFVDDEDQDVMRFLIEDDDDEAMPGGESGGMQQDEEEEDRLRVAAEMRAASHLLNASNDKGLGLSPTHQSLGGASNVGDYEFGLGSYEQNELHEALLAATGRGPAFTETANGKILSIAEVGVQCLIVDPRQMALSHSSARVRAKMNAKLAAEAAAAGTASFQQPLHRSSPARSRLAEKKRQRKPIPPPTNEELKKLFQMLERDRETRDKLMATCARFAEKEAAESYRKFVEDGPTKVLPEYLSDEEGGRHFPAAPAPSNDGRHLTIVDRRDPSPPGASVAHSCGELHEYQKPRPRRPHHPSTTTTAAAVTAAQEEAKHAFDDVVQLGRRRPASASYATGTSLVSSTVAVPRGGDVDNDGTHNGAPRVAQMELQLQGGEGTAQDPNLTSQPRPVSARQRDVGRRPGSGRKGAPHSARGATTRSQPFFVPKAPPPM